jgi:hypothetical protein
MDTNITQSFIEMVEAYKAKPELEAQVRQLGEDNALCYQTIEQLRFEIEMHTADKAKLSAQLSEVMKERDDASFRNLELEEKLNGIERLLGLAERVESARKAEHEATVAAMTLMQDEQEYNTKTGEIEPQGQSVMDPTSVGQTESDTTTSKVGLEILTQFEPAPEPTKINPYSGFRIHYPNGEYANIPYYEKPSSVSWIAFVDGGGEAEPWMNR